MAPEQAYYRHSGRVGWRGPVPTTLAVVFTACVFSPFTGLLKVLYFIDLAFVGEIILAWSAGLVIGWVAKKFWIRSETYVAWLGAATGVLLLLATWSWYYVFLQMEDIKGFAPGAYYIWEDPARFFAIIDHVVHAEGRRAESVVITILVAAKLNFLVVFSDFPYPTGAWLFAYWGSIAVFMVLFSTLGAKAVGGRESFVFCETCEREAKVLYRSPWLGAMSLEPYERMDRLRGRLERGDFAALNELSVANLKSNSGPFARLILRGCDKCHDFYCVDINKVDLEGEEDREASLRKADDDDHLVIRHLLLPTAWYERLRAHFGEPDATAKPAEEDGPWLVIFVVLGVMAAAMAAIFLFDL